MLRSLQKFYLKELKTIQNHKKVNESFGIEIFSQIPCSKNFIATVLLFEPEAKSRRSRVAAVHPMYRCRFANITCLIKPLEMRLVPSFQDSLLLHLKKVCKGQQQGQCTTSPRWS